MWLRLCGGGWGEGSVHTPACAVLSSPPEGRRAGRGVGRRRWAPGSPPVFPCLTRDYYKVVKDAVAEGYDSVKIDPVFAPTVERPMPEVFATQGNQIRGAYRDHDLKRSVERIAAAREAGGDDLDIIVEIHSLLDANTAAILGKALEPD